MARDRVYDELQTVDLSVLGARLREMRQQRRLTQQDLAGDDISAAYVSRIEAGQRRPELTVAQRLAERLDTSVEFLVTGVEPVEFHETELQVRYAELALRTGEAADAVDQLEALQDQSTLSPDQQLEVLRLLGNAREAIGDLEGATVALEKALDGSTGRDALLVAVDLSRCYREAGDLNRSIQVGEAARLTAASDDLLATDEEVRLVLTLAAAYFERGDVVYAAQQCRLAIERAEANQSNDARAAGYWNASIIASERGQHRDALAMAARALALLSEGDDRCALARLKLQYGAILLAQDPPVITDALHSLEEARDELVASGAGAVAVSRCDVALARAHFMMGDVDEATSRASSALTQTGASSPFVAAEAFVLLGRIAAGGGATSDAQDYYRRAVAALSAAQADREVAELWYELGDLLEGVGDNVGSRDAFRSASASLGLRIVKARVSADRL